MPCVWGPSMEVRAVPVRRGAGRWINEQVRACKNGSYDPVQQRCKMEGDEKEYELLKQRRQTLEAWDWKKWLGNCETK
jgi:hypothetical protein